MAFPVSATAFGILAVVALTLAALVFRHGPTKYINRLLATFLLLQGGVALGGSFASALSNAETPYSHWAFLAANHFLYAGAVVGIGFFLAMANYPRQRPKSNERVWPWVLGGAGYTALRFIGSRPLENQSWAAYVFHYLELTVHAGFAVAVLILLKRGIDELALGQRGKFWIAVAAFIGLWYIGWREATFLALYPMAPADWWDGIQFGDIAIRVSNLLIWIVPAAIGGIWLARRNIPNRGRVWIGLAIIALSAMLDSLALGVRIGLISMPFEPSFDWSLGPYAIWNAASIAMIAFIVLKGQVPGISITFRKGLSRSSIAAIFVAVFFVVSEAAQEFFGQETGNQYFGIAGAGLLVLAISPLQRLADRLANAAIPGAAPLDDALEAYRTLLSKILKDGNVSSQEEKALALAATSLGLTASQAFEARASMQSSLPT